MDYLLAISVGPVQEFIATARRSRDLWFGSWLLSEISKTAASKIHKSGGKLIFPASGSRDATRWRQQGGRSFFNPFARICLTDSGSPATACNHFQFDFKYDGPPDSTGLLEDGKGIWVQFD